MKTKDPVFEWKDAAGNVRRIQIVMNHNEGLGINNPTAVADVRDIVTGELLEGVPLASLVPYLPITP